MTKNSIHQGIPNNRITEMISRKKILIVKYFQEAMLTVAAYCRVTLHVFILQTLTLMYLTWDGRKFYFVRQCEKRR